jgi:two-component system alkaline phosphatase synthesis response regulator PhoP
MEKKHTKTLLVDDEPDILEIVVLINQEGYHTSMANGEAIAKAKRNCPI